MDHLKPTKTRRAGGVFLLVFLFFLLSAHTVRAQEEVVIDTYGLFSQQEARELAQACAAFRDTTGIDAAILSVDTGTVGGIDDQSTIRFVEAYGDENLGENYIALIINMDTRYYYIDIKGNEAFSVYTDRRQEELGDAVVNELAAGAYAEAGFTFLRTAEEQYRYAHATGSYGTVQPQEKTGFRPEILGISGFLSAIAAAVMTRVRAGSHREKRLATDADRYVVPGTVNMYVNRDTFVSQYVTRVPRVKQEFKGGGGGFTTTHMSGGGHSHSGHGGHF